MSYDLSGVFNQPRLLLLLLLVVLSTLVHHRIIIIITVVYSTDSHYGGVSHNFLFCTVSGFSKTYTRFPPFRLQEMLRSATDFILRNWFRCALVALVFGYASEYVERNEPYWEPDVAYLHWSTDVPTVTVCQMDDTERFISGMGHSKLLRGQFLEL